MSVCADGEETSVFPDRHVYLRLRWLAGAAWRTGGIGLGTKRRLLRRRVLRVARKSSYIPPCFPKTRFDKLWIPSLGIFHFLEFRRLPQSQRANDRLDYRSRLEDICFALNDIQIRCGVWEFLKFRHTLRARVDDHNSIRLEPCGEPKADQRPCRAEREGEH